MDGVLWALLGTLFTFGVTTLGALNVYWVRGEITDRIQGVFLGFAGGVMIAASVWSLLLPAIDRAAELEQIGWLITAGGFLLGVSSLLWADALFKRYYMRCLAGGRISSLKQRTLMMIAAITIHNIPEGIAVAIPIYYATKSKGKALLHATLSGMSEVIGALLCLAVSAIFGIDLTTNGHIFPLIMAAVAGIMIYISLDELLPTAEKYGKHHIAIAGVVSGMAIMGISLLII
jgi:ZIP family zinc transporter